MASHFHPVKIKSLKQETPDCVVVEFDIPQNMQEEYAYEPGQHLTLKQIIDGEEVRRNYSLCTSPGEKSWRIAIKKMPYGVFSNWAVQNLQTGASIELLPPMGKFILPAGNAVAKHYVMIAAGSGITPVMAIVKHILYTQPASTITLVYGNRDRNSIIFKEELEALKNRYMQRLMIHHIFSREKTDAPIFEGRIDAEKCEKLFKTLVYLPQVDDVFICGPGGMIDTVKNVLAEKNFPKEKIHFELFTAGRPVQPAKPVVTEELQDTSNSALVDIKLDGIHSSFRLPYNGASILDAALARGADLPYACKGGVCCTCKARLLKGQVTMDLNYGLEQEEIDAGYILTCQSHPITDEISIDFD